MRDQRAVELCTQPGTQQHRIAADPPAYLISNAPPIKCGSWLACDTGHSVYQPAPVDAIAGKPAPTLTASRLRSMLRLKPCFILPACPAGKCSHEQHRPRRV